MNQEVVRNRGKNRNQPWNHLVKLNTVELYANHLILFKKLRDWLSYLTGPSNSSNIINQSLLLKSIEQFECPHLETRKLD